MNTVVLGWRRARDSELLWQLRRSPEAMVAAVLLLIYAVIIVLESLRPV